jgi:hypothetical protein
MSLAVREMSHELAAHPMIRIFALFITGSYPASQQVATAQNYQQDRLRAALCSRFSLPCFTGRSALPFPNFCSLIRHQR